MRKIEVVVAKNAVEAREYMNQGYCPIECSFGEELIVDELQMDHHGELSHLSPVCKRAIEPENWGIRSNDRRFVTAGGPDADACLAILALCGETAVNPHTPGPDLCGWEYNPEDEPWKIGAVEQWERNAVEVIDLYRLAARRDRNPHVDMVKSCAAYDKSYNGNVVLLWFLQQRFRCWNEALEGFQLAFDKWRNLCWRNHKEDAGFFDECFEKEKARREQAKRDMESGEVFRMDDGEVSVLLVAPQGGFGFDVFYQEHDFVVQMNNRFGSITIGARDEAAAQKLGSRGLRSVFDALSTDKPGWGGSPTVGGSPRGVEMGIMDAFRAVNSLCCELTHQATYQMVKPHLQL